MKKLLLLIAVLCLAGLGQAKRGGEGHGEDGRYPKKGQRGAELSPEKAKKPSSGGRAQRRPILREEKSRSRIVAPRSGPDKRILKAKPFARREMGSKAVRAHLGALVRDREFLRGLPRLHREERVPGRYYWHRWRDADYCHYYDPWGYHWYGWYLGPRFFWVRVYGGRWWWYDEVSLRWCYWYGGWWWWPDPLRVNVVYVYRDGEYVEEKDEEGGAEELSPTAEEGKAPYIDPKDMPPAPEEIPDAP